MFIEEKLVVGVSVSVSVMTWVCTAGRLVHGLV